MWSLGFELYLAQQGSHTVSVQAYQVSLMSLSAEDNPFLFLPIVSPTSSPLRGIYQPMAGGVTEKAGWFKLI